jgi:hypothetical protein
MARVRLSAIASSLRGALGDVVFKLNRGRVIATSRPDMSRRKLSPKQKTHITRFTLASAYGRHVRDTPELRTIYEPEARRREQGVYHIGVRDYMNAPRVDRIDPSKLSASGGTVVIQATDDFEVVRVEVAILTASGETLEAGEAARKRRHWHYDASGALPAGEEVTVRVRAFDRPGNRGEGVARVVVG